ncbi:hypothetical protein BFW25_10625 [Aeromonas caviae]|uniref:hypothetical protein n=1 Tax=Aeromonas caviae TaxID=648 RepID=UPI00084D323A|nr:hypothetical protein [Aeromonas caviae]OEG04058.1 hypothetical protein BFW25_10625 [Aeromonas caviae]
MTESAEKNFPAYSHLPKIEDKFVVYRDVNIVLKNNPDKDAQQFAEYLKGEKSKQIFQQLGWSDKF